MRRIISILALIVCAMVTTTASWAQSVREIKNLKPYDKISLASGINLILTKGTPGTIKIEGERTVVTHVICQVREGELQIYTTKFKYKNSKRINIYVPFDSTLTRIDAPAGNRVRCEEALMGNRIELIARNGCDFYVNAICGRLKVRCTNGSTMRLLGEADVADIYADNSSTIKAYDMECKRVMLTAQVVSDIEVTATESLSGTAVSDCEVRYKGDPQDYSLQVSSGSRAFAQ